MDKKGQVYLLAAVILSIILFSLVAVKNLVRQDDLDNDFSELSSVYDVESARFLNALLEEQKSDPSLDVSGKFFNFSYEFASYSKSRNPNYELFYVFKTNNGAALVGNFLNSSIALFGSGSSPLVSVHGCFEELNAQINFGGIIVTPTGVVGNLLHDCYSTVPVSGERIKLCIVSGSGADAVYSPCYPLTLSGKPQLLIVTGASEGEQRQVYVGGEGVINEVDTGNGLNEE